MTKLSSNNNTTDHVVDLGYVYLRLVDIISRNTLAIVIIIVLCTALTLAKKYFETPVYSSNLIVSSGIISLPMGSTMINELDKMVEEKNFENLAIELNLSLDKVATLKDIQVINLFEKNNREEDINIYEIKVEVTNTGILSELEKGIMNYLEKNPYVKKRVELKKKMLFSHMEYLEKEIQKLEDLKNKVERGEVISQGNNGVVIFDPVSLFSQSNNLVTEKLELESEFALADNFHLIQSFRQSNKPNGKNFLVMAIIGIIIGIIVSVVVVFFLELRIHARTLKMT